MSNAIDTLHYKKEYASFTFEVFITQLTKHYNMLEQHSEFTSEETNVRNLLKKITDPTLEASQASHQNYRAVQDQFCCRSQLPLIKRYTLE